ncbi:MAG TPA: PsiF family protein [Usitatibacteraceae bacterium]|nr:PsiF family protein [Usitatibacteraceae bacterium]
MKIRIAAFALAALLVPALAFAADPPPKCLKEAKGLEGGTRDRFLANCAKAEAKRGDRVAATESPARLKQQEKMKACHAEATRKSLKGDERRAHMSACLKG